MNELLDELSRVPGVEEAPSQFHGEPALWVNGREFLHFHGPDLVEIRLTRRLIAKLEDERAPARARYSDWVMVRTEHRDLVLDLAVRAAEANRGSNRR